MVDDGSRGGVMLDEKEGEVSSRNRESGVRLYGVLPVVSLCVTCALCGCDGSIDR